jgi:hypothetical protein
MAWTKGRCWPGIETQAGYLGRSEDSINRYHRELEAHGLLIINRSGKYNRYYPSILQGQPPRPNPQQPHRTGAGRGGSIGRTHAALTPKSTELQNVKNVPVEPPQPEWLEGYWDHLRQQNDENVDKSWLKQKEVPETTDPFEPEMRVPDDLDILGNADIKIHKRQETSDVCDDQPHPANARTLPDDPAPDPEKVQETSAKVENRGDSPVRVPDDTGTGVDSPMRVRRPKSQKVFDAGLLNEILDLTGDRKSLGCWISCVSRLPEEEIRIAMSSLRQAMMETDVYRPGGYMLGIIKSRNPEFSFSSKGKKKNHGQHHDEHRVHSTVAPPMGTRTPHVRVPVAPPSPPEPPPPSIEDLVKGWRFASRSISISRLLEIMKTSVGDALDPSALWSQVKDLCPGKDERTVIDRFLEVVTTRLRHYAEMKQQLT